MLHIHTKTTKKRSSIRPNNTKTTPKRLERKDLSAYQRTFRRKRTCWGRIGEEKARINGWEGEGRGLVAWGMRKKKGRGD